MRSRRIALATALFIVALTDCSRIRWLMHLPLPQGPREEYWGFVAPWDPRSLASASTHRQQLTTIVSGWVHIDTATYIPAPPFGDTIAQRGADRPRYAMLVTTYQGSRFHPETIRALASDSALLQTAAQWLARYAAVNGYRALVLDFEGMTPADLEGLLRVVRAIRGAARVRGIQSTGITVPATDTAGYPGRLLLSAADYLIVMLYDQHWVTSPPGPIAAPEWAARSLGVRVAEVGANRIVAAFPLYGYKWNRTAPTEVIGFDEAHALALREGTELRREPSSQTLRLVSQRGWELWVADSGLLQVLMREARRIGVWRFAFWRLGLEDRDMWTFK
jgi:peptidoglycan-N-acetylglucosamine deacetylase